MWSGWIWRSVRPFSLCLECNAPLRTIDKQSVLERLPPSVQMNREHFTTCDLCGRIYWEGSHWQRMQALLTESLQSSSHPCTESQ